MSKFFNIKKIFIILVLFLVLIIISSCNKSKFSLIINSENLWYEYFDIITRTWGYNNNGVTCDNVEFSNDLLVLNTNPSNKIGAALSSKEYFGSGCFETTFKTNIPNGACIAFWTFYYEDDDDNEVTPNINHEIDMEFYGQNNAIYSTYLKDVGEQTHINKNLSFNINDNLYHNYKFDFISGNKVTFYIDNKMVAEIIDYVPYMNMKIWIGVWCPTWATCIDSNGNITPEIKEDMTYQMTIKEFKYTMY